MVYRRNRRRYRRRRRRHIRSRRLYRKHMRRTRRRTRRGGRSFTVGYQQDYALSRCSLIPAEKNVLDTAIGIPSGGFTTWCINPLPPSLITPFGGSFGSFQSQASVTNIGTNGSNWDILTDLPVCVSGNFLYKFMNCQPLWELCDSYRISWIAITFTVPENVASSDGTTQKNHHLYLEWTHLPCAHACTAEEWATFSKPSKLDWESSGWNHVCSPIDVAEACSIVGKQSLRHHWNRSQLSATTPVTIRWRPRHSKLHTHTIMYQDTYTTSNVTASHPAESDNFSQSRKLIRGYVDARQVRKPLGGNSDSVMWLGPVIRLVDADRPIGSTIPAGDSLYTLYGIRCSCTIKLKLKGMEATTTLFKSLNNPTNAASNTNPSS